MNPHVQDTPAPALRLLAPLAAWTCYAPLGAKYLTVGLCVLTCAAVLYRAWREQRRLPVSPQAWTCLALLALLALSIAWTPAPLPAALGQLGQYALPWLLATIAAACPPQLARSALAHFVVASAVTAAVFVLAAIGLLPEVPWLWHTSVLAEGNQRIATSLLLAMGAALGLWLAVAHHAAERVAWSALAALCALALALQDRRSGMLLLPLLLLVWGWTRERTWTRRALTVAAVLVAAAATWQLSDGVRQRFEEGVRELREYRANDQVATSWGQRVRMWQVTAQMVRERPWLGHGIASWKLRWNERVTAGTPLAANTTPHSEYLLLAQQAGVLAPALWLVWLGLGWRQAARAGFTGLPALMAVTALAWTGLFNAVLRDAKFSLPLLLLAVLGLALAKPGTGDVRVATGR